MNSLARKNLNELVRGLLLPSVKCLETQVSSSHPHHGKPGSNERCWVPFAAVSARHPTMDHFRSGSGALGRVVWVPRLTSGRTGS